MTFLPESAGLQPLWKNGTLGNPFINGDVAVSGYGRVVMVAVAVGESVEIQLPTIKSGTGGKRVAVRNLISKQASRGTVLISPDTNDSILSFAAGEQASLDPDVQACSFESDGVARWNSDAAGTNEDFIQVPV